MPEDVNYMIYHSMPTMRTKVCRHTLKVWNGAYCKCELCGKDFTPGRPKMSKSYINALIQNGLDRYNEGSEVSGNG